MMCVRKIYSIIRKKAFTAYLTPMFVVNLQIFSQPFVANKLLTCYSLFWNGLQCSNAIMIINRGQSSLLTKSLNNFCS